MSTFRSRISGLVVAAFIATTLVGVASASPAEAAGCVGSRCNGLDAEAAGCGPGTTLQSFRRANTFIELRYSPGCNSVWGRGVSYNTSRNCTGWTDQDVLRVEGSSGGSIKVRYERCLSGAPGHTFRTAMVGFNYWTRACLVNYAAMSSTARYNGCTAWQ